MSELHTCSEMENCLYICIFIFIWYVLVCMWPFCLTCVQCNIFTCSHFDDIVVIRRLNGRDNKTDVTGIIVLLKALSKGRHSGARLS